MLQLGKLHVQRVVDMEDVPLPPERGFPDLTPAMLRQHARRLGPQMVDPVTLNLLLSFHTYVVRSGQLTILVDTCIGNDKDRPRRPDWHGRQGDFLARLRVAGVRPEDVDVVMCTHLHADHVGWNTRLVDGRWVPTFPNARYVMADIEYRALLEQVRRDGPGAFHGCLADSVLPVVESGQAEMVGLDHRVAPGVHTEGVPGHTPGSVLIHLEDDGAHGICTGDLIHHPFQLSCPEMHTNYCADPAEAAARRMAFCARYADTATRVLTAHFPAPSSGRIVRDGPAYEFVFDES